MSEARPIVALLVEDDEDDYLLTRDLLADIQGTPVQLHWAPGYDEGLQALRTREFDVLLLDYGLGLHTGLELLDEIGGAAARTPTIVLTGTTDHAVDVLSMRHGASDYLVKGRVGPDTLERSIRYSIEHKRSEREQRFLAEAGTLLASSLDPEETLRSVARLAVESLADWCVIDIVAEDGSIQRLEVAHRKPERAEDARRLLDFPLVRRRPYLVHEALESGRTQFMPVVAPRFLETISQGPEHLEILRSLRPSSFIAAPLMARDRVLGVLLLVLCECSQRRYDARDVRLAESLARLAALSMDNARLFRSESGSRVRAERAVRARDEVLGIVAHDLRNPLSAITMTTEILREAPVDAGLREQYLANIARSAEQMDHLIQDLLDVARIEAGRLAVRRRPVRITPLLQDAWSSHCERAEKRGIEFHLVGDAGTPDVFADPERLQQVLGNLLGNALKFTPTGGRVELGGESTEDTARIWVRDSGPGISEDDLPHLFDRFWQGNEVRRDGTGLGLPIAQGIVQAHDGRLWVDSRPGEGSTFYFSIPIFRP
jgi:signal transduction histidine kinase/ActR/RegA family two-component response regulator